MRKTVVKKLRRLSREYGVPLRALKRAWRSVPRPDRCTAIEKFEEACRREGGAA